MCLRERERERERERRDRDHEPRPVCTSLLGKHSSLEKGQRPARVSEVPYCQVEK